ncbi:MAG: hypothetical protein MSA09_05960 [Lachnospiraceae bacterium]|nr:hypothetical protein [Lachnospiraceae bacterium]
MIASRWLNDLVVVLILLFNAGMVTRITKTLFDGLGNPEGVNKKKIQNQLKALAVIDGIAGVITFIESYFKG